MNGLEAALILSQIALDFSLAMQRAAGIISQARAEGRDVTDEELAQLKAESTAAAQRLLAL